MSVSDFYDAYVDRQTSVGINARHHSIVGFLSRFGLRPDSAVLEIGSGVGTLTELLAGQVAAKGDLVAVDLSPKSVAIARERLSRYPNIALLVGDALEIELARTFDIVVLPDVIEHIPLASHPELFRRVALWLQPDGFALLHYPNPHHLQWVHEHRPHLLQIVDQPIHADRLLANCYRAGLYLDYYETYSIWVREGDYVVAVLRPLSGVGGFTDLPEPPPSVARRVRGSLGLIRRRFRSTLRRHNDDSARTVTQQ